MESAAPCVRLEHAVVLVSLESATVVRHRQSHKPSFGPDAQDDGVAPIARGVAQVYTGAPDLRQAPGKLSSTATRKRSRSRRHWARIAFRTSLTTTRLKAGPMGRAQY